MKKIILLSAFLCLNVMLQAQIMVFVQGYVKDSATGNAIANHMVIIRSDSSNPATTYPYYSTVYTNANGFYLDTVPLPTGTTQWACIISTFDCINNLIAYNGAFGGGTTLIQHDFLICSNSNPSAPTAITGGATGITQTSTVVNGSVNPNSALTYVVFEFGTTTSYGHNVSAGQYSGSVLLPITTTLNGLTPATTYHYRIKASNSHGTTYGVDSTFTTLSNQTPIAITGAATLITSSGGTIHGTFNAGGYNATAVLELGITTAYNNFLSYSISGYSNHAKEWGWYGLLPNTTYHYRASLIYPGGTIYGADSNFTTLGASPCHAAFTISPDSANVNDTIHFFDQSTSSSGPIGTYIWAFGDGAVQTITFPQNPNVTHAYLSPGTYVVCLAIQGSDSTCYDQTCDTIVVGGTGCQANYSYSLDPASGIYTVNFTNLSTGGPATWLWNFGDGSASTVENTSHTYTAPGTYQTCLMMTTNNCTSTYCQNVVIPDTTAYNQIYGQIFAGSFPLDAGMVMIFSLDTSINYQPYFNVFNIDSNGIYYFTLVPQGNYYILAIPFDSNGYLPTYYGDVLTWQQATLITLGTPSNPYNINLLPAGVMASGPGSASGLINMARVKSTFVDKVNMILKNDLGEAIGFTQVKEDGSFNFSEMAYGTYYLYPEMPGIISDQIAITLTAEKPHAEVNMTFNGNKITGFSDETDILTGWSVYPNPVDDALTLSIDLKQSSVVQLGIYTLAGQQVYQMQASLTAGRNQVSINPSHLQAGMYLLKVTSNDGIMIVTKVIKK
ncbi:MAG: PKD domain-containing protein [Alphaproteobacteria bacterium]|nr:PKD domain-containing protein [Alphaproteobacteria bacterium]